MASGQRVLLPAPPNWPGRDQDPPDPKASGRRSDKINVACIPCRKRKSKCDGLLPCTACNAKQVTCQYEEEPGVSRRDKLKSQVARSEVDLSAFTTILSSLRGSSDQAESVVTQLESGIPVGQIARSLGGKSPFSPFGSETPAESSAGGSQLFSLPLFRQGPTDAEGANSPVRSWTLASIVDFMMAHTESIENGLASYPDSHGYLFHTYDAEDIQHLRSLFSAKNTQEWTKLMIYKILSLAAIGAQYSKSGVSTELMGQFYNTSQLLLDDSLELAGLETVKLLALPAMYNIMDKAVASLAYIEAALALAVRYGLAQNQNLYDMSPFEWRDYRKAWRTLVLFRAWITSSQGNMSNDGWGNIQATMAELHEDIEAEGEPEDAVQLQVIKIAVVKYRMLRTIYKNNNVTSSELYDIRSGLEEWHKSLPTCMQTHSPDFQRLNSRLRFRILYVHFLYLGVIVLVHRQVLATYLHAKENGISVSSEYYAEASMAVHEGLVASKQASRFLTLILEGEVDFCPCWLCVFQTCTCCVVMLHDVGQRVVHKVSLSSCSDTLSNVSNCLLGLDRSGNNDPVIHNIRTHLRNFYDVIIEYGSFSQSTSILDAEVEDILQTSRYLDMLSEAPIGDTPLEHSVRGLMDMVRRPFNSHGTQVLGTMSARIPVDNEDEPMSGTSSEQAPLHSAKHSDFDDNRLTAHLLGHLDHGHISGTTMPPGWMSVISPD